MGHGDPRKLKAQNFINMKYLNARKYFQAYACVHAEETRAAELLLPMEEFQAVACIH